MKPSRKVSAKEVKRCFLVSNFLTMDSKGKRKHLSKMSQAEFSRRLALSKRKVLALTEHQLEGFITDKRRLQAYNSSDWHEAVVNIEEAGVWTRAGGLPLEYTNRSLKEIALRVQKALLLKAHLGRTRALHVIPNMLRTNVGMLQDEKYLLPILFKGGTGTRGRWRLKHQTKYDIDDGCMRSIALAASGQRKLRVYVGIPKKTKKTKN